MAEQSHTEGRRAQPEEVGEDAALVLEMDTCSEGTLAPGVVLAAGAP